MTNKKSNIIGTGLSGMVGSRIAELLFHHYNFENLSLETGIDITNKNQVMGKIGNSQAKIVLHLAAKTDVDRCEQEKNLGEKSQAWQINVHGTKNIVDACYRFDKQLIYISTDFVFDGRKNEYNENDQPNPINFYGLTKYMGEKIVQKAKISWIICRISFPYRQKFTQKLDFVRTIKQKLEDNLSILCVIEQKITPTFIDDIAFSIKTLIEKNAQGIYHLTGSSSHTPFEAANIIARIFNLNKNLIKPISYKKYFQNRALRPKKVVLKNSKIKNLGVKMKTFRQGLLEIKKTI